MSTKLKHRLLTLTAFILLILAVTAAAQTAGFSQTAPTKLYSIALAQDSDPSGANPVILTDEQGEYQLGLHLDILEDPDGELTIDEVASPEFESQFIPSMEEVPNFGFTDSVYWVRLWLDNQTSQTNEWLLELGFANMHYADLYTPLPDGDGFEAKQTGSLMPVSTRDLLYPRIVFDLSIPPQSQQTFYLRFQSGASMTLGLTLWTKDAFWIQSQWVLMFNWIFYGALFALLIYHSFLLFTLREASYLLFVILLASLLGEELSYDGYLEVYLFPNLYSIKSVYYPLLFSLLIASTVLFSDTFLELKTRFPKMHLMNIVSLAGWGALMLLTPFTSYHIIARLAVPWALVSLAAVWVAGIATWRKGFQPARFFMIAWLGLIASIILVILVRMGIAPSTTISENAYRLGMIWMAVCWSIALADRISLLKAKTESANLALRDSEHRLSEILEGLPIGVVVYGKDQKPNYVNRQAVEILQNPDRNIQPDISAGRSLAEGINYFSLKASGSDELYPLENFPVYDALRGQPASADNVEIDYGETRAQLEIIANPVRDASGNVESAVVAIQDISSRKQAEMALQSSETRFRVITENNYDGIAFLGRDRKLLYVSPSYLRLVGKSAEEVLGKSGVDFIHPDDRGYTAKMFTEALQQPNTRIIAEYRVQHKDGSWIWIETFAVNLLDHPDVQAVVLNSHDITYRKQTETELAEYRKHLESLVENRTLELNNTNEQLRLRLEWLSAINLINQIMAGSTDFTQIYEKILVIVNRLFMIEDSFIAELDEGNQQLKILAHSCPCEFHPDLRGLVLTSHEGFLVDSDHEPRKQAFIAGDQLSSMSGTMGLHIQISKVQGIALQPLLLREKVFGYLGLEMHEEGRIITGDESSLLDIFAIDIAQLIENSHLIEQTKALITVEERSRLARDLHDSVTQVLFSASLLAEVLPQIWQRDPELGRQKLEKLRQLTRGALAEMRTMLLELRPSAVINTPLSDLLLQLAAATTSRSGLPFKLFIEQIPSLPENVQINFYRITQEALNNIVKHAQASQITLSLSDTLTPDSSGGVMHTVKLVVEDDGVGFYSDTRRSDQLGISIMYERAAAIQASLSFNSQPGYGAQVTLIWSSELENAA